ncbi:helix-turn-helix transcriptional regulator [Kitasatospora sp. NPDC059088]|uniref:helix-turn-helix transcriptional regulator n=1 Tax=Kitasatospora sp. NPDC059088 TaxID=3346722 RepID=UPI0036B526C4
MTTPETSDTVGLVPLRPGYPPAWVHRPNTNPVPGPVFSPPAARTVGTLCRVCCTTVTLSSSEASLLTWLAADLSTDQIARRTYASVSSALAELGNLAQALGAETWPQAVDHACRSGLLLPQPTRLTHPLPGRDLEIVQSQADGRAVSEIAERLGIREGSVTHSLARTRRTLGTSGSPAAVYRLHAAQLLHAAPFCPRCPTGSPS